MSGRIQNLNNNEQMNRYARQTSLPEIGEAGQEKLRNAKVLIVGVGGLGSPIALYLAGAGVGTLGLVDDDLVSISNLQRQVLYAEADLGQPKPLCGARRVQGLNSDVNVEVYPFRLDKKNAGELIRNYDIVVDGCDNFATRYLLNDVCNAWGKPYVYGAIQGFEGQVSVFCYGESAKNYRDLYPDEEGTLLMPSPDKSVIGVTPAIVGSVEANEVLKLICGYGEPLAGKLWTIDLRTMQSYILSL
jgi:molybdopterin/thiamine biosynthesis adenylyltransferase